MESNNFSLWLQGKTRRNIWHLKPYSCARDEFKGRKAEVFLDANENPFNGPYNRYPDPQQDTLKKDLAELKGVKSESIFLGNGSDEAIDLVLRTFCEPRQDNVVTISPTYGMYSVAAAINDVTYRSVALDEGFQLNADELLAATDRRTKIIFLCTPNNPTGNALERHAVERVIKEFDGLVVVDEAYSDFSTQRPFRFDLASYPNLIVLNTMSKAWASAGIRLGMAFAHPEVVALMNKVKYPYNVNSLTIDYARQMIAQRGRFDEWIKQILLERAKTLAAVGELPLTRQLYPTDANFFLVEVEDAPKIYNYLIDRGIVVRSRHNVHLCHNCLRITIGTRQENNALVGALRQYRP